MNTHYLLTQSLKQTTRLSTGQNVTIHPESMSNKGHGSTASCCLSYGTKTENTLMLVFGYLTLEAVLHGSSTVAFHLNSCMVNVKLSLHQAKGLLQHKVWSADWSTARWTAKAFLLSVSDQTCRFMHCPYPIKSTKVLGNSCIVKVSWETLHQDVGSIPQNWRCCCKNHQGEEECADRVHQLYSWIKFNDEGWHKNTNTLDHITQNMDHCCLNIDVILFVSFISSLQLAMVTAVVTHIIAGSM